MTGESTTACPACSAAGGLSFFHVDDVPAHSVLLMPSADEARSFPRGSLDLAVCQACGFIWNRAFRPELERYGPRYEETQHYSPTFQQFAHDLAVVLIRRYALRERTIVEIGCGKGEFLALLCELGPNRGIGIDPACIADRVPAAAAKQIQVVPELFAKKHTALPADFLVCRHTLEHIPDVSGFLKLLRSYAAARPGIRLMIEVPETRVILAERRFWDFYYEHCSCFTPGSLTRALACAGWNVIERHRDYGEQYLWVVAEAADPVVVAGTIDDAPDADVAACLEFGRVVADDLRRWRDQMQCWRDAGKRVAVWGAGSKAVAFLTLLGPAATIDEIVDVNPHKQGNFLPGSGHEVRSPAALRPLQPDVLIIMNRIYRAEIADQLATWNLQPTLACL